MQCCSTLTTVSCPVPDKVKDIEISKNLRKTWKITQYLEKTDLRVFLKKLLEKIQYESASLTCNTCSEEKQCKSEAGGDYVN